MYLIPYRNHKTLSKPKLESFYNNFNDRFIILQFEKVKASINFIKCICTFMIFKHQHQLSSTPNQERSGTRITHSLVIPLNPFSPTNLSIVSPPSLSSPGSTIEIIYDPNADETVSIKNNYSLKNFSFFLKYTACLKYSYFFSNNFLTIN